MSVILEQIHKAEQKAQALDIGATAAASRDKTPLQLSSAREQLERRQFLRDSLQDLAQADQFFERILVGNELQDVNYLARGAVAAKSIARVAIRRTAAWPAGARAS